MESISIDRVGGYLECCSLSIQTAISGHDRHMAASVISSQGSTLPHRGEWCFECYAGLQQGRPVKEAKFKITCDKCHGSMYGCEDHSALIKCPACGPGVYMHQNPASCYSASTTTSDDVAFGLLSDAKINGLEGWLASLSLQKYVHAAVLWCHEQGASSLQEVFEHWTDFAEALSLKPLEKDRVSKSVQAPIAGGTAGTWNRVTLHTVHEEPDYFDWWSDPREGDYYHEEDHYIYSKPDPDLFGDHDDAHQLDHADIDYGPDDDAWFEPDVGGYSDAGWFEPDPGGYSDDGW